MTNIYSYGQNRSREHIVGIDWTVAPWIDNLAKCLNVHLRARHISYQTNIEAYQIVEKLVRYKWYKCVGSCDQFCPLGSTAARQPQCAVSAKVKHLPPV
jgi:hypothetical protein